LKQAPFITALSATRHHPSLRRFRQRLIARRKKPILAPVAVRPEADRAVPCSAAIRSLQPCARNPAPLPRSTARIIAAARPNCRTPARAAGMTAPSEALSGARF
jgi:hypothetical protein